MKMNLGMPFRDIHVLLVEHESRDHDSIMNLLYDFSYKVTSVELASTALSIISKGKDEFDLAMVNMNSPDLLAAQLLHEATKIHLPLILMSNVEIDKQRALMGLEQGAYLCMQKPITMSMVGYLWQIVVREKDLPQKASAKLMVAAAPEKQNNLYVLESDGQINFEQKCKSLGNAKSRGRAHKRKSDWMEWTVELHYKFMAAAKQLGQGKCYPNDILEIMDVPGLTRMQVASHLQKCRSAKWLPPNKRNAKAAAAAAGDDYKEPKSNKVRANKLRFGLMPNFDEDEEEADDDGDAERSSSSSSSSRSRLDHQSLDIKQSSNDDQYFRELLPITDISMLDDHGFHQDLSCPSIFTTPDYDEYEVGVGLMADHWFCGALNPDVEREECTRPDVKKRDI